MAEFLAARLNELEEDARAAAEVAPAPWVGAFKQVTSEPPGRGIAVVASTERSAVSHHIERWEPARVLREVAAKRAILDRYTEALADLERAKRVARGRPIGNADLDDMEQELRTLRPVVEDVAAIWSDHPDYRAHWAPS